MPVPDKAYFAPTEDGKSLHYGEVRAMAEGEQFSALQRRFDHLLLGQINELARFDGDKRLVYSPFPLFVMTCVGIETAGKIFFARLPSDGESEDDIQREGFLGVCNGFHPRLPRPLAKEDKAGYDSLRGVDEHKKVRSYTHLIYRFGRHTMIHGYRGKGVYLTEVIPDLMMDSGAFVLNPYWFWSRISKHSVEL